MSEALKISMSMISDRIFGLFAVSQNNPELLREQYRAFSRQMPMMYPILLTSTWALAATHLHDAPLWMTVGIPLLFTLVAVTRVVYWWKLRNVDPSPQEAHRALIRTNRLAIVIAVAFTGWSLLLFPYGDAYSRSHVAFYMAITVIACIFCLMHLRSAALMVTVIVNGAFIAFFASTGEPTFIAIAINIALVSIAMLAILSINYRDFARMVNARTEARRKEEAQARLLHMIDDMPVAVMTVEPETFRINYANETSKTLMRSIEHLLPIKADELVGTCIDVFHKHPEHQRRLLSDPANLPHNARITLGSEVIELKVSAVMGADGSYLGPMLSWAIVTKEVEIQARIRQLAHYDALTGLANRITFRERLEERIAIPGNPVEVLFIDLDGFKLVNDSKGHRVGDELLRKVAQRLCEVCDDDEMMIGRLGGDEFAVLAPCDGAAEAEQLAARIIKAISAPYALEHVHQVQIGASVGIALTPMHGVSGEALLARADMALYAAKAAGKGTYRLFSDEMEARVQERVRLEARLHAALQANEGLFVFYQPIVDVQTNRITAREALVRWHHPEHGWISPREFIPVAEQSGLIDLLGEFVLNRACRDALEWQDDVRVAVNISAVQLGKGTIPSVVLAALVSSGLSPSRLEVEVTETALLEDERDAIADLRQLRGLGVRVALDDFGTGYSSLAHLRAFPFDKIKIDGSFVRDALRRPDCAAVVRAVAQIGKRLGVTTVAEGVETEAQLQRMRKEGCTEVQGFLYGAPKPSARDAAIVEELNRSAVRRATA